MNASEEIADTVLAVVIVPSLHRPDVRSLISFAQQTLLINLLREIFRAPIFVAGVLLSAGVRLPFAALSIIRRGSGTGHLFPYHDAYMANRCES